MKHLLKVSIIICFTSCGANGSNDLSVKGSKIADTSNEQQTFQVWKNAPLTPLSNSKQILGRWHSHGKEPLSVLITADSIFYLEHHEAHKYVIEADSIFINFWESRFGAKVGMVLDTLVFESDQGRNKLTRAKEVKVGYETTK